MYVFLTRVVEAFSCLSGEKEKGGFARPEGKAHRTIKTITSSITFVFWGSALILADT